MKNGNRLVRKTIYALLTVAFAAAGVWSSGARAEDVPAKKPVELQGAGATFPYPLYSKWIAEYAKVNPGVRINYQSIGSGGGIRQLTARTVDFGASDAPMTDSALTQAGRPILHIPTTLGAVVLAFNLPNVTSLTLTPEVIAGLFLGEITSWNDPKLVALNPAAKLPKKPVTIVHRADGSGTTAVFTDYLARVSPAWKEKVGNGLSVKFPTGLGAKGNEGVAGQLKTSPGAIGYVELAYAKQTGLSVASLKNSSGAVVQPTIEALTAAAAGLSKREGALEGDLRLSLVNSAEPTAWPIASFTYILLDARPTDAAQGAALRAFLDWALHDGQAFAPPLHYAPLPKELIKRVETMLKAVD